MKTLKIVLKLNAVAQFLQPYTLKPPIGDELTFDKGKEIAGQHDIETKTFWVRSGDYIAPIPANQNILEIKEL